MHLFRGIAKPTPRELLSCKVAKDAKKYIPVKQKSERHIWLIDDVPCCFVLWNKCYKVTHTQEMKVKDV